MKWWCRLFGCVYQSEDDRVPDYCSRCGETVNTEAADNEWEDFKP